ncbi:uncharacterized protein TrAFT101_005219 [Trichoderma asperellum]|uniref:uncharacterized protein n=1 Tax=Trichoderma asperellum TaxID=101201 RepID=UPI003331D4A4|nr:hypothetical protein TrAFT101_005219 [Trichoderma asperellum]
MNMGMPTGTTAAGSSPTGSAMNSSMGDMGDMMGMGGSCQISMLWNWNVIDACFISETWQIKSKGMFAGSCIGVILLVMALEFLRRLSKEYDRFLIKQHTDKFQESPAPTTTAAAKPAAAADATKTGLESVNSREVACPVATAMPPFRPSVFQQAIRALIHMVQFAVAYFVMLLAMYYNGYFIICIFIGAYLGSFIFGWETLSVGPKQTSAANEATVCCG